MEPRLFKKRNYTMKSYCTMVAYFIILAPRMGKKTVIIHYPYKLNHILQTQEMIDRVKK